MDAMSDRNGQIQNVRVGDVEFKVSEQHAEPEPVSISVHFRGELVAWISCKQIRESIDKLNGDG